MRGFLLCFIFAPVVRIFARRMIRVTLAAFSILPELSCRFPVHFAISLFRVKNSYICPQRHQFDMAKEGYVNLLPVQHKRSRDPGDSAEMMQARRAFLDAGHYQPLRDAIVGQLRERLDERPRRCWILAVVKGITHAFADALPEITTFGWMSRR